MFGVFWAIAADLLAGPAAAAGLAFINSVGTLGGFVAPVLMGLYPTNRCVQGEPARTRRVRGALTAVIAPLLYAARRPRNHARLKAPQLKTKPAFTGIS